MCSIFHSIFKTFLQSRILFWFHLPVVIIISVDGSRGFIALAMQNDKDEAINSRLSCFKAGDDQRGTVYISNLRTVNPIRALFIVNIRVVHTYIESVKSLIARRFPANKKKIYAEACKRNRHRSFSAIDSFEIQSCCPWLYHAIFRDGQKEELYWVQI